MKKRLLMMMLLAVMLLLVGCGNADNKNTAADTQQTETESVTDTETTTEIESETTEVESESTTEVNTEVESETPPQTETESEVPQPSEPQAPTYTYTDLNKMMYAKSSVNVRSLPSTDGEKLGGLSKGQEVSVSGQCNETGWYRISYNGGVGYVSSSYLVDEKPAEEPTKPVEPVKNWYDGYERYVWYDMGEYFFMIVNTDAEVIPTCNNFPAEYSQLLRERYPDRDIVYNGANIITDTYSVALVSALYMDPEKGFPIWSIDYLWK